MINNGDDDGDNNVNNDADNASVTNQKKEIPGNIFQCFLKKVLKYRNLNFTIYTLQIYTPWLLS